MAFQLPTYESSVNPQPAQQPGSVHLDTSIGDGLQNIGNTLSNIAERKAAHDYQQQSLEAQLNFMSLNEASNNDLLEVQRQAPASGQGIEKNFVQQYLRPKSDAFLSTITDPDLKQEYAMRLDVFRQQHANNANNLEYKQGNAYSIDALGKIKANAGNSIVADPSSFAAAKQDFMNSIDNAPLLTPAQREEAKTKWNEDAPAILVEALKVTDPQTRYFITGNGTKDERYSYLTNSIVKAVVQTESSGGPNQVSEKGAVGLMQIMPDTAVEIATIMHDTPFLKASPAERKEN